MNVVPISLREANEFISRLHRHHKPVQGHKWSIGLAEDGELIGVAVVGRPVSRYSDDGATAEVTRLCTDGTANACSMLYGAAARVAKAMGYSKIQTYILQDEPGVSLKAAGWVMEAVTTGGQWKRSDGSPRRSDQPTDPKQRWSKHLAGSR